MKLKYLVCLAFLVTWNISYADDNDIYISTETTEWSAMTSLIFGNGSKQVGSLSWDEGVFKFKGDADKSAKLFFEFYLKGYVDEWIKQENKKCICTGTKIISVPVSR